MIKSKLPLKTLRAASLFALLASFALAIGAQSGRRARNPPPAPVPVPEATPNPTPTQKPKPALTFLVGLDKYGDSYGISLYDYDGVLRSCAGRLNDSSAIKADIATRDMSRGDAIRQAKAEQQTYIVWIQLRSNTFSGQTGGNNDPNSVYIQYSVFAPVTAKQVTSGNTYPEAYRRTTVRVPSLPSSGNYYLNQAARAAADRILDHFHVQASTSRP